MSLPSRPLPTPESVRRNAPRAPLDSSVRSRPAGPPPLRTGLTQERSAGPPPLPPVARPAKPPPLAPALALAMLPEASPFTVPAATTAPDASPFWAAAAVAPAPRLAFEPPPGAQSSGMPSARQVTPRNLDDLPDFLDGRARGRRAVFIVLAIAILALLGTIGAAIVSNYSSLAR